MDDFTHNQLAIIDAAYLVLMERKIPQTLGAGIRWMTDYIRVQDKQLRAAHVENAEQAAEIERAERNMKAHIKGIHMRMLGMSLHKCPYRARSFEGDTFEHAWEFVDGLLKDRRVGGVEAREAAAADGH